MKEKEKKKEENKQKKEEKVKKKSLQTLEPDYECGTVLVNLPHIDWVRVLKGFELLLSPLVVLDNELDT